MVKNLGKLICLCIMIFCLTACGKEQQHTMKAMYVTFGDGLSVFIEPETETVFYAAFPEKILDINGKKITQDQLVRGNLIEITGNGVMAESFPGQYNGVTKMQVVDEGQPADADQYQFIIDQIYQEPDLSLPPELSISYKTEIAAVSMAASTGSYEWENEIVEGSHILQWSELIDAIIAEPTKMLLTFSLKPSTVSVERFPEAMWQAENMDVETQEPDIVEVTEEEDGWTFTAEPGFVYLIQAGWEQGQREFGFYTPVR